MELFAIIIIMIPIIAMWIYTIWHGITEEKTLQDKIAAAAFFLVIGITYFIQGPIGTTPYNNSYVAGNPSSASFAIPVLLGTVAMLIISNFPVWRFYNIMERIKKKSKKK